MQVPSIMCLDGAVWSASTMGLVHSSVAGHRLLPLSSRFQAQVQAVGQPASSSSGDATVPVDSSLWPSRRDFPSTLRFHY